jgi:pseudouridine-5'-phosphate glycosidase
VEKTIIDNGAVPATIAVINGRVKIGLSDDDMKFLATSKDIIKASRLDLPVAVAAGMNASTTVAATMICAHMAGINVFVTGGIGGVHRGAQQTFDISADLQELAHTNVAVVCAGAKAILDLKLTMEYLETFGIPVLGWKTDELAAFYSSKSGIKVNYRVDDEITAAKIIKAKWEMGIDGGVIIANPIPEEFSMDPKEINDAIDRALEEAERNKVYGKNLTPFLLEKIKELTSGESLESNIALIKNNAYVGAIIAKELNKN